MAMQYEWTVDGTYIPEIMNVTRDAWIHGTAIRKGQVVFWEAQAQREGYYVIVREHTGRLTSGHCGGTFNLCLEVASQVKRAIS